MGGECGRPGRAERVLGRAGTCGRVRARDCMQLCAGVLAGRLLKQGTCHKGKLLLLFLLFAGAYFWWFMCVGETICASAGVCCLGACCLGADGSKGGS